MHARAAAAEIHWCSCADCVQAINEHPVTHEKKPGKPCGRKEFYAHRKRASNIPVNVQTVGDGTDSSGGRENNVPGTSAQGRVNALSGGFERPSAPPDHPASAHLQELQDDLARRKSALEERGCYLAFENPPHALSPAGADVKEAAGGALEVNSGTFGLAYDDPQNTELLEFEQWLLNSYVDLEPVCKNPDVSVAGRAHLLRMDFSAALAEVERWKVTEWERQRREAVEDMRSQRPDLPGERASVDTEPYIFPNTRFFNPLLLLCYLIVATLHLLCGLSLRRCRFLLGGMHLLLTLAPTFMDSTEAAPPNSEYSRIVSQIPFDARTVVKDLAISPKTKPYVCCRQCFAIYPLGVGIQYPDHCTQQWMANGEVCGAELRRTRWINGQLRTFPARQYIYHDFKDWLGRLLCRPGMEEIMDRTLVDAVESGGAAEIGDFYDTQTLRDLNDPDGNPFIQTGTTEGRYVFSICMDGFLPSGKGGNASVSVGAIYLACLNLPISLRYKEENLFLCGIVPGPTHPSQEHINPLLSPLVDDFLDAWYQGIRYTRTSRHNSARTVRCMLCPLVSDLLAARQMAGFSGHSSNLFCSHCFLKLDDIDNLEWWLWPLRRGDEQRAAAQRWMQSDNPDERAQIFREHGIRWSELMRLPYWDPVKFTAIDPMHALLLGLFHRHCSLVWGMDSRFTDGLEGRSNDPARNAPTDDQLREAHIMVKTGTDREVQRLPKEVARLVCKELNLAYSGRIGKLHGRLLKHRMDVGWPVGSSEGPRPNQPGNTPGLSWTPLQDLQLQEILAAVRVKSTSPLPTANRFILVKACARVLGGSEAQYSSLRVSDLRSKLGTHRDAHGISEPGNTDETLVSLSRNTNSGPPTQWEIDYALAVLDYGTKSQLRGLRVPVLVELCAKRLPDQASSYCVMKREQLLNKLHAYLDQKARSNASGCSNSSAESFASDVELIAAEDVFEHGSKTKLKSLRAALVTALCVSKLGCPRDEAAKLRKKDALSRLEQERCRRGITDEVGRLIAGRKSRTRVLGQKALRIIWAEMKGLVLPSHVSRAPSNAGAPGSGTLSADEWRTFCTVNLVVTLGWAWGTLPSASREYALFHNFMDLVTAVKLATARSVTEQSLWDMQTAMYRYLKKLLELFPGTSISPYQHMCLGHLPTVLRTLGPAHAIWCFVFERANFILQRIKTNSRIDDLSVTLLNRFCSRQNLRALFSRMTLPQALQDIIPTYVETFETETRGTLNDVLSFDSKANGTLDSGDDGDETNEKIRPYILTQDVFEALHARTERANHRAISMAFMDYLGARYKPYTTSRNDGVVVFRTCGNTEWRAGRIREIFKQAEAEGNDTSSEGSAQWRTWIIVEEYQPLEQRHRELDPYKDFPVAGGRLFYSKISLKPLALTASDILCHAASMNRSLPGSGDQCVHILPLDKW